MPDRRGAGGAAEGAWWGRKDLAGEVGDSEYEIQAMRGVKYIWVAVVVIMSVAGCATEPRNLSELKREILHYVDGGDYERDVERVATAAAGWIERRAARGGDERLAVVFDVDETLLSNLPSMTATDFGYVPAVWEAWVDEGRAPAIESVREVYERARRLGVTVFFITGRAERGREGTERNLRAIGCSEYEALICKPEGSAVTTGEFKRAERERIAAEGFVIIANIGDQESDFFGGGAERGFKVPAPFYRTE